MADDSSIENAPANMRNAYLTLQQIYGEEAIPLFLGTEMHGGKTDMAQIEVGKDQMMLCLTESGANKNGTGNYHKVPEKYTSSAPFFVLGHEFGHIVAHPGKDSKYWRGSSEELPVEGYQKGRWLNAISDILVNWTVITGTTVMFENQKEAIKEQMLNGFLAGNFVRRCNTEDGIMAHKKLLSEGKLQDNRYQPKGGLVGQYDNGNPTDKYEPTAMTPFYQKYIGHGRGEQYYPPINYCVAKGMSDNWRRVKCLKDTSGLKKGKNYIVSGTKTYDNRENTEEFEPIKEYKIDGNWVSARLFASLCPQCGHEAITIWDNWWNYNPDWLDAMVEQKGTWVYLLIQMFALQYAMLYSSILPLGSRPLTRETGEQFLSMIADDMDSVMRGE
tara:strand:+ start:3608 stop:4768 length:1161 start_codon:yes stop_codon:yes gene_type:complete